MDGGRFYPVVADEVLVQLLDADGSSLKNAEGISGIPWIAVSKTPVSHPPFRPVTAWTSSGQWTPA